VKSVKTRVQSCSEDKEHSPVPCESNIVRKGLHCRQPSKMLNKAAAHSIKHKEQVPSD